MNNLPLIKTDGGFYADSRDVAEAIERPHKDLLKSIRSYVGYLNEGDFSPVDFFVKAEYEDSKGEKRPCYLITKKGCDMIANKLTGKKGVLFTAAYVSAFEQMKNHIEQANLQRFPAKATSAGQVVSLLKNVRITIEHQNSPAVKAAMQTEMLLKHFGIPVIEDFVESSPFEQLTLDAGRT